MLGIYRAMEWQIHLGRGGLKIMCIMNKLIIIVQHSQKFPVLPPPYLWTMWEIALIKFSKGYKVGKALTLDSSPFDRVLLHILELDFWLTRQEAGK